jgi:hypothetical protein
VHARLGVERPGLVVLPALVELDELLGLLQQLVGLVLDVVLVVSPPSAPSAPSAVEVVGASLDSVTVKSARMPSPFIPGLHAVT